LWIPGRQSYSQATSSFSLFDEPRILDATPCFTVARRITAKRSYDLYEKPTLFSSGGEQEIFNPNLKAAAGLFYEIFLASQFLQFRL
jgi:hypothetical protein